MFQQIVVDPIRSRCTGFGLRDWPPQISQLKGFIVDFSVIRGEVNFHHLFLLLYGLECSTVVGGGGVICKCCSMLVSNIFGVCVGSTILSIQILLGAHTFFPDIFLTLSHTCFIGVSVDSFETYSVHDWRFVWLKRRQGRGSYGLCRDQCWIVLPPGDTQLSTRNARLWSQETRPHWRSEQMYDLQRRSPS